MLKPLPTNNSYTVHEILVPSLNKKLRFRPFLVKDNKALMIAQNSGDIDIMLDTLKSIIQSCCVESEPLDADKLATFDFEYLLIKLRSISVDPRITLNVKCQFEHSGMDPKTRDHQVMMDLNSVEVVGLEQYKTKIDLGDGLYVLMKQPTMDMIDNVPDPTDYEGNLRKVLVQIDKICTEDEVYDVSEYTEEMLLDWIGDLTDTQLEKLVGYFRSIPYCRIKVEWTCPVCGQRNIQYIEGISYFF